MSGRIEHKTEDIIAALKATNGLVSLAAKMLKVSPQAIYKRAKQTQCIQQVIDDCRKELVDIGELALRGKLAAGESWAVALVLKTLGRNRGYVERQEIAPTDPSGQNALRFNIIIDQNGNKSETE